VAPVALVGQPVIPHESIMMSRRADLVFGAIDVFTGVGILVAVFVFLPTRVGPVDWTSTMLAALQGVAGAGLLAGASWRIVLARIVSAIALALGLLTFTTLLVTATWLGGVYGQVGRGGAIVLGIAAALILPYLILFPLFELVWLHPETSRRS
jgi:hypothetical protein